MIVSTKAKIFLTDLLNKGTVTARLSQTFNIRNYLFWLTNNPRRREVVVSF